MQAKRNFLTNGADRLAACGTPDDPLFAQPVPEQPIFVIRARDLDLLETFQDRLPRPLFGTWINRGTGRPLRQSSIAMLLRTLECDRTLTLSAQQLQQNSGLRLVFATTTERHAFARAWKAVASA